MRMKKEQFIQVLDMLGRLIEYNWEKNLPLLNVYTFPTEFGEEIETCFFFDEEDNVIEVGCPQVYIDTKYMKEEEPKEKENLELEEVLNKLIGYRLEWLNNEQLIVFDNITKEHYNLDLEKSSCRSNSKIYINNFNRRDEPFITNIKAKTLIEEKGQRTIITLYEKEKVIGEINAFTTSEDGWCRGSYTNIYCKDLEINEIMSKW